MDRLFLIDAYALIYRFYYAFIARPMRNSAGLNTSSIYGFVKFLRDLVKKEQPRYLGVAFDPGGLNFRHELYEQYKANREATPEDIKSAVPYIKKILEAMRIPILEIPGYEADDVIGTLSMKAAREGFEVFMVTPDKDFGQLIRPTVKIYKPAKGDSGIEIIGCERIKEVYGIDDPCRVIDILALWGDASDNIPGVPGIGEKSASKLVCQFGTVEDILANTDKLSGKQKENIEAHREQILLAKNLATIELDVPVEFEPSKLEMETPDIEELADIYKELGLCMFLMELQENAFKARYNASGQGTGPAAGQARTTEAVSGQAAGTVAGQHTAAGSAATAVSGVPAFSAAGEGYTGGTGGRISGSRPAQAGAGAVGIQGNLFDTPPAVHATPAAHDTLYAGHSGGMAAAASGATPAAAFDLHGEGTDLFSATAYKTLADIPHTYHTVTDRESLRGLADRLEKSGEFCFDTETTGFDIFGSRLVGISFAMEPHEAWYVACNSGNLEEVVSTLRPAFENEKIAKTGQNIKFDIMVMRNAGIEVRGKLYDPMIIHYLLDPESRHGMDHLARTFLNYSPIPIENLIGKGTKQLTLDMVPVGKVSEYSCEDADITLQLRHTLWPELEKAGLTALYDTIEEPLIGVLADIEMTGVKIDSAGLAASGEVLSTELGALEQRIRELAGEPSLNVNSAKQLGEVLFGKMKIDPKPRTTKTKQYRTDEEYLQSLYDRHPVVRLILEYRGLKKLLSTYVEALPSLINPVTGRIHTSFNQAVTATGRLSSTNPNLQNIPIRDDRGREIRRAFIPSDAGHLLLSADYSQIELRLMAHLSGDEAMLKAFSEDADIHTATAARLFGVPETEVTREQRRRAKTANFGIIYGISGYGLGQRLNIPRTEAAQIITEYFRSYPGVKKYMEDIVADTRGKGFVTTLFGRRRMLPDINSGNAVVRGLAERNAINAPIQGGAADIMKLAMIAVHKELGRRGLESKIILQVHDELVIDMLIPEKEEVEKLVVECMENAARLKVKLIAEAGTGKNWLEAH